MEFHWWYIFIGLIFFFIFFGKGKGGVVVKRLTANMEILDQRFDECRPEAEYSTFKEGSPDHIDIEIEQLPIQVGEELEFQLNRKTLANVKVERDKEAEFDQWSDELVIKYQGVDVLKGTFQ